MPGARVRLRFPSARDPNLVRLQGCIPKPFLEASVPQQHYCGASFVICEVYLYMYALEESHLTEFHRHLDRYL